MLARGLTTLISIPIIFACTYFGGTAFEIFVICLALFSLNEFYGLMLRKGFNPSFAVGNFFTLVFIIFAHLTLKHPYWEPAASVILTFAAIVTLSAGIFLRNVENAVANIALTLFGMLYVGWLFSYLVLLRALTPHGAYLFFLMVAIWANDIAAYIIGTRFGRHKLSPFISPKKTVEGAAAGFIVCVAAAIGFGFIVEMGMHQAVILGIIISVIAQASDLVESLIKRDAGVKDSSNLVPGHGGVLDRMDSFILAAPVTYYYLSWFIL